MTVTVGDATSGSRPELPEPAATRPQGTRETKAMAASQAAPRA
jgi:hypothetical protein